MGYEPVWRSPALGATLLLLTGLILPLQSSAAVEGAGTRLQLRATRTAQPPVIDGEVGDAPWAQAVPYDEFFQQFPTEGAPPSERTEVRVLFDDRNVYVAVTCFDSRPEEIVRRLGRRDEIPGSDQVTVAIDSAHDHRTAYFFSINAAGVMMDGLYLDDARPDTSWDAVWDGAATARPDGWSAELAIPLHLLRFDEARRQVWGFGVRRHLHRTHEVLDSAPIPLNANALVSRFAHLVGIDGLAPRQALELSPYLAARWLSRPAEGAQPALSFPSMDVGLDLKTPISSNLSLIGSVNPDFGQVEVDQIIQNLTTFETFLPEKRPFFTQGLDLFVPPGADRGRAPHTLLYSRRIGAAAPIFAAAKIAGAVQAGWSLGMIDVFEWGASAPAQSPPDGRVAFHRERPLHVGPNLELPESPPVPTNYFATVVQRKLNPRTVAGLTVASALRFPGRCQPADPAERPEGCDLPQANAGAMSFSSSTDDGSWVALGQVAASQVIGGPDERTLRDGTVLRPSDPGYGGYVRAGKLGGEPFRFQLDLEYATPKLELNTMGYQQTQNVQKWWAQLKHARPSGSGYFRSHEVKLRGGTSYTADGWLTPRGGEVGIEAWAVTPGFNVIGGGAVHAGWEYDVRELTGLGVAVQRPDYSAAWFFVETDQNRAASLAAFAEAGYYHPLGPVVGTWGYGGELLATLRPHPAVETRLTFNVNFTPYGPKYVEGLGDGRVRIGDLHARFVSLLLRQQLVLTPKLVVQAYAQLFSAEDRYVQSFEPGVARGARLHGDELIPVPADERRERTANLTVNLVLRWEYRSGSTLFLVYSRAQAEPPLPEGEPSPGGLMPSRLWQGPATDQVLLKWTYGLSL